MQTFLTYPDFHKSIDCLDRRRLFKQAVEARQLINIISTYHKDGTKLRFFFHPICRAWLFNRFGLIEYYNVALDLVINKLKYNVKKLTRMDGGDPLDLPTWFGDDRLHLSHRSNLLRKDPTFYGQYGWDVPDNLPYWWPVDKNFQSIL